MALRNKKTELVFNLDMKLQLIVSGVLLSGAALFAQQPATQPGAAPAGAAVSPNKPAAPRSPQENLSYEQRKALSAATEKIRTEQTAAPLAVAHHLEPVIIKADDAYAKNIVDAILRDHKGETVVVIGHSNTTPDVIRAFSPLSDSAAVVRVAIVAPRAVPSSVRTK